MSESRQAGRQAGSSAVLGIERAHAPAFAHTHTPMHTQVGSSSSSSRPLNVMLG
jgi:hypothetical protein